jgi:hypothetical protein
VQCPVCSAYFTAAVLAPHRPPPPPPPPREERAPPPPRGRDYDEPRPSAYGREYDDPRRPRYEREYDDSRRGYGGGHGRGGYYRDPYRTPRPHRGGAVLTLGLLGLLFCCTIIGGLGMGGAAISMANADVPEMDRGLMDESGRGLTQAGRVCGTIAVVISSLALLFACIILANQN